MSRLSLTVGRSVPAARSHGWRRVVSRPAGAVAHPVLIVGALALELVLWGGDGRIRLPGIQHAYVGIVIGEMIMAAVLLVSGRSLVRGYAGIWTLSVLMAGLYPGTQPFVGLLLVLFQLSRLLPWRRAAIFVIATAGPWTLNTVNALQNTRSGALGAIVDGVLWSAMTVVVWMIARYVRGQEELARAREQAAIRSIRLAIQEERMRLARELHDVVSHSVSAVILQAAGARNSLKPDPAVDRVLEAIESTSTSAARELRGLLGLLGPATAASGGDVASPHITDLSDLLASTRACGIDITVEVSGVPGPIDERRDVTAYRVVQEALTNVIRHAGTGSKVSVQVSWSPSQLILVITSIATAPPKMPIGGTSGRGLAGLRQRVEEVGGQLDATPIQGNGYQVSATIPYGVRVGKPSAR